MYAPPVDGDAPDEFTPRHVAAYVLMMREGLTDAVRAEIFAWATTADEERREGWDEEDAPPAQLEGAAAEFVKRYAWKARTVGILESPVEPVEGVRTTFVTVDGETITTMTTDKIVRTTDKNVRTADDSVRESGQIVSLGDRLRYRRKEAGLSAAALGAKLAPPVTHHAIFHWENGRSRPNMDRIYQLAHVLGVNPAHLLDP